MYCNAASSLRWGAANWWSKRFLRGGVVWGKWAKCEDYEIKSFTLLMGGGRVSSVNRAVAGGRVVLIYFSGNAASQSASFSG